LASLSTCHIQKPINKLANIIKTDTLFRRTILPVEIAGKLSRKEESPSGD